MIYAILVIFIILFFIAFSWKRKKPTELPRGGQNRRRAFRLKFENAFCDFQPLATSSSQKGTMRDISADGIGIETQLTTLSVGSLLMLYFDLGEERFILEGMVKRKEILPNGRAQYGIRFINSQAHLRENLHKKLWSIGRQRAQ